MRLSIIFLLYSFSSYSSVPFNCYSIPGVGVQTFEYTSAQCLGVDSENMAQNLGKAGEKQILCMYQAACEPVVGPETTERGEMTSGNLLDLIQSGELKGSMLLCPGVGVYSESGVLDQSNCPSPSECQQNNFYNFSVMQAAPITPRAVTVPASGSSEATE